MVNFRKRCCRCKVLKTAADFGRNRTKPDGLKYSCKSCTKEYTSTPEKLAYQKEYQLMYRQKNTKENAKIV